MAKAGVRVAHCPRSNIRLDCPHAPIREMLDAGIEVGLGLDSPASGGPIDMFAEMRAAQQVSLERGKPLTAKEIWQMATGGAAIGDGPLIKIECELVQTTQDLMDIAIPKNVFWPNVDI